MPTRNAVPFRCAVVFIAMVAGVEASRADEDLGAGRAQAQAQAMYQAYARGDIDAVIAYMHPRVVKVVGGKPKIVALLKKMDEDMRAKGMSMTATVSAPQQIIRGSGKSVQAIIPMEVVLDGDSSRYHQPSYLLALSDDGGKSWKFVDTGQVGAEQIRKLFPECSPALKIPSRPAGHQSPK